MPDAEEIERLQREVADLRRQLEAREGEIAVLGLIIRNGGKLPVLPKPVQQLAIVHPAGFA